MLKDIVSSQKLQKEQLLNLVYIERTKEPFAKKWLATYPEAEFKIINQDNYLEFIA